MNWSSLLKKVVALVIMRRHFFWWFGITLNAGFNPWLYSFVYHFKNSYNQKSVHTYLIAEIFESESEELTLGNPSDAEVEPGLVVLVLAHVGHGVTTDPDVKVVFLETSLGPRHVSTAELATKHDL